ncbi:MAG: hypothetical protein JSV68_05990, partial [Anaerolineaceae bacterium]
VGGNEVETIDQAHYLAELVEAAPELELALPVSLNIVCFRYVHPELDAAALDELNRQIVVELQELPCIGTSPSRT